MQNTEAMVKRISFSGQFGRIQGKCERQYRDYFVVLPPYSEIDLRWVTGTILNLHLDVMGWPIFHIGADYDSIERYNMELIRLKIPRDTNPLSVG